MNFKAVMLADSISPGGARISTVEAIYPRIVHGEILTHRQLSRNAASSRAIPNAKVIQRIVEHPFIPDAWGANQSGMQAGQDLPPDMAAQAEAVWLRMRDEAVRGSEELAALGVHKQLCNRPLEAFQWYTAIITATEWSNFFALRCHPDAQPQIQQIAVLMREALASSEPVLLKEGQWHMPLLPDLDALVDIEGCSLEDLKKISAARCARVTHVNHMSVREPEKDIAMCEGLIASGHLSPLEHVATPSRYANRACGNLRGWVSMRKDVPHENDFSKRAV